MYGNTNQPIDVMVQTGYLFEPMPTVIREDMAFIGSVALTFAAEFTGMSSDLPTDVTTQRYKRDRFPLRS
jgi:ATP-dependent Lon protease